MTMSSRARKLALTVHVAASVGWLGAVAGFLALAIAGLASAEPFTVRGAYLAMDVTARFVIVPLAFVALVTGLVQSLGTKWGLFRHYWILVKLLISLIATSVLLLHMQPIAYLAGVARETTVFGADLDGLRAQLVANAGLAIVGLLVNTALAIYKPRGMTPYGWRKQHERRTATPS
jgi:hypothetical protein